MVDTNPWAEFTAGGTPGTSDVDPWAEFKPAPLARDAKTIKSESSTLFGTGTAETTLGELGAGIQKGVRQVISTAPALASFGVRKFEDITGADTRGLDEALMETSVQVAEGGAKRGIDSVEELELLAPSTWARYTAGVVGEAIPFVASIMTGAGGARFLASLMAKKGVPSATRSAIMKYAPSAEVTGAVATAAGIESAATGQELWQANKDIYTGASLLAGTAKGALEAVFPLMLGKSLGLTGQQAGHLLDRIYQGTGRMGRVGVGAGVEGGTELVQEEVDIITRNYLDENYAYLGPEANSRRLNAAVAGGVGGGFFSSFKGSPSDTALSELYVRQAAGDVPFITGQSPDELPVTGPEAAIDASLAGLDATVGVANQAELDDLQSTVDIRHRGLFAAAIPGTELTFGSQDQALNDGANAKISEYLRLDPDHITRGDLSVSVEDLPNTIADPRVDFLTQATMKEASDNLVEAIKWKQKAEKAKSPPATENALAKAAVYYRQAMDNGARVEPFPDSQVVLRNQAKHLSLMQKQGEADLQSKMSKAQLRETRTRDNGKSFYVLQKPRGKEDTTGSSIDLERVRPGDITAFPTSELSRQIQADQQISRKLDLGRARAKGVRFEGGIDEVAQKALLQKFVQFLQGAGRVQKGFQTLPKSTVERFMELVDGGLRLDVTPDTNRFALLRQLAPTGVQKNIDVVGPEVVRSKELNRIVRARASRTGEPRVGRFLLFADNPAVEDAYFALHHGNILQGLLSGTVRGGAGKRYTQQVSPLGNFLRELLKPMRIKTDVVLQIVEPGSLEGAGVSYKDISVVLTQGKTAQLRSVIRIDPWFYSQPTAGGKALGYQSQGGLNVASKKSKTQKAAGKLGIPAEKQFVTDEKLAEFYTDFSAQVGKVILSHEWEVMGAAQQELFKTAYRRERHVMAGQRKDVQLARVMSHPILERTIGEQRGKHRHSYNFEEWMLQNIARWMIDPQNPIGPVKKFFYGTGNKIGNFIIKFLEFIKNKVKPWVHDPNLGRPAFVVDEWLKKLFARGRVIAEEPFLSEPTRRALEASLIQNQGNLKAIGLDKYVIAYPERSSTYRVKQLMKLLPADAHADRAKLKGLLAVADRHSTMMEWLLGIHQMADLNPHISGLQAYKSLNRAMENTALSWASLADNRIRQVQLLGKEQGDNLWRLLF